jgi:hypothetical protein
MRELEGVVDQARARGRLAYQRDHDLADVWTADERDIRCRVPIQVRREPVGPGLDDLDSLNAKTLAADAWYRSG